MFPMVVQGTWKMVVMGHINFDDQVLIKRWQASEKWMQWARSSRTKKNGVTIKYGFCFLLKVVSIFEVLEITEAWM